jgi:desulfoferrodoxin-like iron-binding protein
MLGERIQHADWKKEKHVPIIDCPSLVKADDFFEVKVSLGKEIAHPNTTEHHIRWICLYFHPEGQQFTYDVVRFEFNAHGEARRSNYCRLVQLQWARHGPVQHPRAVGKQPGDQAVVGWHDRRKKDARVRKSL